MTPRALAEHHDRVRDFIAAVFGVTVAEVTSAKAGVRPCETCGETKPDGRRECGKCRIARYRSDPEKAARSREASRRWKAQEYERQLAAWNQRQEAHHG